MTYPKGYNPPGGPNSSGGTPSGSNPKPKRRRRGAIGAVIIIIILFIIGVGAYSSTNQPTAKTSSNLETSSNLGSPSEESTSASPQSSGSSEPASSSRSGNCDPAYPTVCIASPPPDLNCPDVPQEGFTVLPPDPHDFDRDGDGIACDKP